MISSILCSVFLNLINILNDILWGLFATLKDDYSGYKILTFTTLLLFDGLCWKQTLIMLLTFSSDVSIPQVC